jgi:hypothetical protein
VKRLADEPALGTQKRKHRHLHRGRLCRVRVGQELTVMVSRLSSFPTAIAVYQDPRAGLSFCLIRSGNGKPPDSIQSGVVAKGFLRDSDPDLARIRW